MKANRFILLLPCIGLFLACIQPETLVTTECYKDNTLTAYIADTAFYPQEKILIEEQFGYVASQFQPLELPKEWKGNDMFEKMVTFYNVMEILHAIETDHDAYLRYTDDGPDFEDDDESEISQEVENENEALKKELMAELRKISLESIPDASMQERIRSIIEYIDHGNADVDSDVDVTDISDIIEILTDWFPKLPNDSLVFKALLGPVFPNHHLPSNVPNVFSEYVGPDASPTSEDAEKIINNAFNANDFNAKASWNFVAMGLRLADADYDAAEVDSLLLIEAEKILTSGNYSPMLDLLWRAYRVKYNNKYSCPSTWCYSPNLRYNHFRRAIAYTTLRHIEAHPEDDLAKIQYYYLALHTNINRFNPFPLGNSSEYEYYQIYWNQALLDY